MSQELTEVQQKQVTLGLAPKLTERQELINSYNEIIKLELTEENLPKFKALRLQLVKNRTAIGEWKTREKAFYLAGGNFVQAIYNKEIAVNKDMEEKLLEGEQHFQRLEAQRLEKIRSERWEKLSKFVETEPVGLSLMEEAMFESLLLGSETTYNNKIESERKAEEERLEGVRLDKLEVQRINTIAPLHDFKEGVIDLRNCSDDEFNAYLDAAAVRKAEHQAKQKAIQEENDRLKAENDLKDKRAKELQPYIVFIRDYNGLISKQESEYQKDLKDIKKCAEDHWEFERKEQLRKQRELEQQQLENKRLQSIVRAKREAELKEAKRLEELAKAPVKEQLTSWVDSFELPPLTTPNDKALEIIQKFKAYKNWAKNEIEKI